jgi:hypothetical protein
MTSDEPPAPDVGTEGEGMKLRMEQDGEYPHLELSAAQALAVADHLMDNVTEGCPMCRTKEWDIAALSANIAIDKNGDPSTQGLRTISVVCRKCHFVAQFATKGLKLFPGEK